MIQNTFFHKINTFPKFQIFFSSFLVVVFGFFAINVYFILETFKGQQVLLSEQSALLSKVVNKVESLELESINFAVLNKNPDLAIPSSGGVDHSLMLISFLITGILIFVFFGKPSRPTIDDLTFGASSNTEPIDSITKTNSVLTDVDPQIWFFVISRIEALKAKILILLSIS